MFLSIRFLHWCHVNICHPVSHSQFFFHLHYCWVCNVFIYLFIMHGVILLCICYFVGLWLGPNFIWQISCSLLSVLQFVIYNVNHIIRHLPNSFETWWLSYHEVQCLDCVVVFTSDYPIISFSQVWFLCHYSLHSLLSLQCMGLLQRRILWTSSALCPRRRTSKPWWISLGALCSLIPSLMMTSSQTIFQWVLEYLCFIGVTLWNVAADIVKLDRYFMHMKWLMTFTIDFFYHAAC